MISAATAWTNCLFFVESRHSDGATLWLYSDYWIVIYGENGEIAQIDHPLPWTSTESGYYDSRNAQVVPMLLEDINADGRLEWVVLFTRSAGMHTFTYLGWLYVLGWQDGHIVELAPLDETGLSYDIGSGGGGPELHLGVEWEYPNLDDDPALEIQQRQSYGDNWRCGFLEVRTFDWDADAGQYMLAGTDIEREESAGCAMRDAQTAMWDHDYPTAISEFERMIALEPTDEHSPFGIYGRVRLVLAYALNGQYDEAAALLDDLRPPSSEGLDADFVNAITVESPDQPLALCAACVPCGGKCGYYCFGYRGYRVSRRDR